MPPQSFELTAPVAGMVDKWLTEWLTYLSNRFNFTHAIENGLFAVPYPKYLSTLKEYAVLNARKDPEWVSFFDQMKTVSTLIAVLTNSAPLEGIVNGIVQDLSGDVTAATRARARPRIFALHYLLLPTSPIWSSEAAQAGLGQTGDSEAGDTIRRVLTLLLLPLLGKHDHTHWTRHQKQMQDKEYDLFRDCSGDRANYKGELQTFETECIGNWRRHVLPTGDKDGQLAAELCDQQVVINETADGIRALFGKLDGPSWKSLYQTCKTAEKLELTARLMSEFIKGASLDDFSAHYLPSQASTPEDSPSLEEVMGSRHRSDPIAIVPASGTTSRAMSVSSHHSSDTTIPFPTRWAANNEMPSVSFSLKGHLDSVAKINEPPLPSTSAFFIKAFFDTKFISIS